MWLFDAAKAGRGLRIHCSLRRGCTSTMREEGVDCGGHPRAIFVPSA